MVDCRGRESCGPTTQVSAMPLKCITRQGVSLILRNIFFCCQVDLPKPEQDSTGALGALFAEELGLVLEVAPEDEEAVQAAYAARGLSAVAVGSVAADRAVSISVGGEPSISGALLCRLCLHSDRAPSSLDKVFVADGFMGHVPSQLEEHGTCIHG